MNSERLIKKAKNAKKIHLLYNKYIPSEITNNIISFIFATSFLELIADTYFNISIPSLVLCFFNVIIYSSLIIVIYKRSNKEISCYSSTPQFSGLYSIDNIESLMLSPNNGLINREKEVDFLKDILKDAFENKSNCGFCLVGESGCGKSTILFFLKQKLINVNVYDYTKKYQNIDLFLKNECGENLEFIDSTKSNLFVFDQFEKYFHYDPNRQLKIKDSIKKISQKAVILFSLRSEYLSNFINEFDIENLTSDIYESIGYGINIYRNSKSKKLDNYFFCSDSLVFNNNSLTSHLKTQCEQAFGTEIGMKIYNKFKDDSLIQQQIIFNILANEKNETDFLKLIEHEKNYFINRFYDFQLCSTDNFFYSSRILYILCLCYFSHFNFETIDLMRALCISDSSLEKKEFDSILIKLHDLQLIKWSVFNSKEYCEIAHDYIAQTFSYYANQEIDPEVRASLDEYFTEYRKNTGINERIDEFRTKKNKGLISLMILIVSLAFCTIDLFVNFFLINNIQYSFINFTSIISIIYVYLFYFNITRFSRKMKSLIFVFFSLSMCSGVLTIIFKSFWLFCLGIGNSFIGLSCIVICTNKMANIGKKSFFSYGIKTFFMGVLLSFLSLVVNLLNMEFSFIIEIVAMNSLLIYAFKSHMNNEFIYSHLESLFSER